MKQSVHIPVELKALFETIKKVRFGELRNVEVFNGALVEYPVTEREFNLKEMVMLGTTHFTKIIIHEGEPQAVEIDFEDNNFKGTQRIRL